MSLEAAIAELTAAVKRNNELLEGLNNIAESNRAKVEGKASAKAEKAEKAEKGDKDRDDDKPKRGKDKEKVPSVAEMKELGTAFLDVNDEDEYRERKKVLKAVVDHFGAERFSDIDTKHRAMAYKLIKMAKDGENLDPEDIEGAIGELEGGAEDDRKSSKRRDADDV